MLWRKTIRYDVGPYAIVVPDVALQSQLSEPAARYPPSRSRCPQPQATLSRVSSHGVHSLTPRYCVRLKPRYLRIETRYPGQSHVVRDQEHVSTCPGTQSEGSRPRPPSNIRYVMYLSPVCAQPSTLGASSTLGGFGEGVRDTVTDTDTDTHTRRPVPWEGPERGNCR
eukprot:1054939-Rhodomonas_salina.1